MQQRWKGWLLSGALLMSAVTPLAPVASAQRRERDRASYYQGMRNGARDSHYDQRYAYDRNGYYSNNGYYNNGYYQDQNQGGVGPGYGALIGGGGGAALGALFGGGLKGTLIGGAAGAALGALGGKLAQGDNNNYYPQ